MPQNKKGRPSSADVFGTWSRSCADAVCILKLVKTGEIDPRGDVANEVAKYIKLHPGRVSCEKNEKGWPIKNFKRNIKSLLESYLKWELSGKGKKQQSKGTNCLFFES